MSILEDLGLRQPGFSETFPALKTRAVRRDVAAIHTAPQKPRCEDHPDHPADDCPECKGYEVRRG